MSHAPIALFVYKRLWHAQQTIASLKNNTLAPESDLFIYSDAAKDPESEAAVASVRNWIKQISGFKNIHVIEREQNFGLARSIIDGVTTLANHYGKVIVIEDDLVLSPYFLQYMNDGLKLYEQDHAVASIHGYTLPLQRTLPATYFMRGADCWGWATWQRAWQHFEPDGKKLLASIHAQNVQCEFDFNGTQKYVQMLQDQINGKNNSWAIRWHASAFLNNMLTLYPGKSLVRNIGFDNSGEHCVISNMFDVEISKLPLNLTRIPLEKSQLAYQAYVEYFKKSRESLLKKIIRRAKKLITH